MTTFAIHAASRKAIYLSDGAVISEVIDQSFGPIAAERWEGFDFLHEKAACPDPIALVSAPAGWTRQGTCDGEALVHPAYPGLRVRPAVALLLAVAGAYGFSLAVGLADAPPALSFLG